MCKTTLSTFNHRKKNQTEKGFSNLSIIMCHYNLHPQCAHKKIELLLFMAVLILSHPQAIFFYLFYSIFNPKKSDTCDFYIYIFEWHIMHVSKRRDGRKKSHKKDSECQLNTYKQILYFLFLFFFPSLNMSPYYISRSLSRVSYDIFV